jgi:hypothetical protein
MKPQSDSLSELAPALVAAQVELKDVVATETADVAHRNGGKHTYKYCDLATVRETVVPVLAKHGLAVAQTVVPRRDGVIAERFAVFGNLRTTLIHSSGQWIAGEQPIAGDWTNPQAIGSAITYARRYGLAAVTGVAQVDDDGQSASAAPASRNGHMPPANGRHRDVGPRQAGDDFDEFDGVSDGPPAGVDESVPRDRDGERSANVAERKAEYNRMFPPPGQAHQSPPAPSGAQGNGRIKLPSDPPRTGKYLFGWVNDNNQYTFFNQMIKEHPTILSDKIKEWTNDQVKWAWTAYVEWVRSGQPAFAESNGRH